MVLLLEAAIPVAKIPSFRRVRSRAYVSFDVQLGWLTICGSHGDQAGG